jgi:prolyl oligopeptidase
VGGLAPDQLTPLASTPYVEEDEQAQEQRPQEAGQPRQQAQRRPLTTPMSLRRDLVETLHGIEVADPWRSLEDGDDPDVQAWAGEQNARTEALLSARPDREQLRRRMASLLQVGTVVAPAVAGDRVFTLERWPPHDQAVLVVRACADAGPVRTLVDPVERGDGDPTAAIDWYRPSPDGALLAYGLSRGGDERSTLHVLDVATGEHLTEAIPRTRACSVAWRPDGSGFFYTRYPDPADVPEGEADYGRAVYHHRLGDDWRADVVAWDDLPDPTAWAGVDLSRDGRWLVVSLSVGWSRTDVHLVDLDTGARKTVIEGVDAITGLTVDGDHLVGTTTLDADRGRVIRAPLATPQPEHWETLVAESDRVVEGAALTAGSLLVVSSLDAVARLDRHDPDGGNPQPVDLPELGAFAGLDGSDTGDEAFLSFTSFTRPPTLFRWTPAGVEQRSHTDGDGDGDGTGGFVVEQVSYASPDGTEIPMLIVRAAGTEPGPGTPCVLSGYGGFAIAMSPGYSPAVVAACQDGGLYAVPGLRGGGERGESWHEAGTRGRKQNVFDDFHAAADWLVTEGWTSREKLAIRGGSNGGLLTAAAVTQRPDLCRAAQIAVPLTDMVRFHRFLIARLWIPEYGDPDEPEDFAFLYAYSPYHRVVDGTCYPAVLLTTADSDSRVDPLHARKFAARLQAATSCGDDRPVLLRIETRAGHGQGKPVGKQADEAADVLAFLRWQLDWAPAGDR